MIFLKDAFWNRVVCGLSNLFHPSTTLHHMKASNNLTNPISFILTLMNEPLDVQLWTSKYGTTQSPLHRPGNPDVTELWPPLPSSTQPDSQHTINETVTRTQFDYSIRFPSVQFYLIISGVGVTMRLMCRIIPLKVDTNCRWMCNVQCLEFTWKQWRGVPTSHWKILNILI